MGEIEFLKRQKYSIDITLEIEGDPDEEAMDQYDLYDVEKTYLVSGDIAQKFSRLIYLLENVQNEADAQRIVQIFSAIDQAANDLAVSQDAGEHA